jgi:uncharacterized membrane protein YdbT with pleckstrin-like domain
MEEKTIFKGTPSQLTNLGYYLLCLIFLPAFGLGLIMFIVRYLKTSHTKIEITNERVVTQTGVLSRITNEIELYRVKDIQLSEPFLLRMFGLSNLVLVTSDKSTPFINIKGVKDGNKLRKEIRTFVEERRDKKNIREIDYAI